MNERVNKLNKLQRTMTLDVWKDLRLAHEFWFPDGGCLGMKYVTGTQYINCGSGVGDYMQVSAGCLSCNLLFFEQVFVGDNYVDF